MHKRIISFIVALSIVMGMSVLPISANDTGLSVDWNHSGACITTCVPTSCEDHGRLSFTLTNIISDSDVITVGVEHGSQIAITVKEFVVTDGTVSGVLIIGDLEEFSAPIVLVLGIDGERYDQWGVESGNPIITVGGSGSYQYSSPPPPPAVTSIGNAEITGNPEGGIINPPTQIGVYGVSLLYAPSGTDLLEVVSNDDWIIVNGRAATVIEDDVFVYNVALSLDPNNTGSERTGTVTLTNDVNPEITGTITVTQDSLPVSGTVTHIVATQETINTLADVPANGLIADVEFIVNGTGFSEEFTTVDSLQLEAKEDFPWIEADIIDIEVTSDTTATLTVSVTIDPNEDGIPRSGGVEVGPPFGVPQTCRVTVHQSAPEQTLTPDMDTLAVLTEGVSSEGGVISLIFQISDSFDTTGVDFKVLWASTPDEDLPASGWITGVSKIVVDQGAYQELHVDFTVNKNTGEARSEAFTIVDENEPSESLFNSTLTQQKGSSVDVPEYTPLQAALAALVDPARVATATNLIAGEVAAIQRFQGQGLNWGTAVPIANVPLAAQRPIIQRMVDASQN